MLGTIRGLDGSMALAGWLTHDYGVKLGRLINGFRYHNTISSFLSRCISHASVFLSLHSLPLQHPRCCLRTAGTGSFSMDEFLTDRGQIKFETRRPVVMTSWSLQLSTGKITPQTNHHFTHGSYARLEPLVTASESEPNRVRNVS